jgi:hypothetical protein
MPGSGEYIQVRSFSTGSCPVKAGQCQVLENGYCWNDEMVIPAITGHSPHDLKIKAGGRAPETY